MNSREARSVHNPQVSRGAALTSLIVVHPLGRVGFVTMGADPVGCQASSSGFLDGGRNCGHKIRITQTDRGDGNAGCDRGVRTIPFDAVSQHLHCGRTNPNDDLLRFAPSQREGVVALLNGTRLGQEQSDQVLQVSLCHRFQFILPCVCPTEKTNDIPV